MIIHPCKSSKASTAWDQLYEEIYIEICGLTANDVETESN